MLKLSIKFQSSFHEDYLRLLQSAESDKQAFLLYANNRSKPLDNWLQFCDPITLPANPYNIQFKFQ